MFEGPVVPPKADAVPGVVGNRHRRRAEIVMEGTNGAGEVAEEEGREEGLAMMKRGQDRRRCHCFVEPCVLTPRVAAERDVVGNRCRWREGLLREGTEGVGVAAEEEEVREEGEGHSRRTRGQNQRCYWSGVMEGSIFVIFAPPDGQRGGEGRWGW